MSNEGAGRPHQLSSLGTHEEPGGGAEPAARAPRVRPSSAAHPQGRAAQGRPEVPPDSALRKMAGPLLEPPAPNQGRRGPDGTAVPRGSAAHAADAGRTELPLCFVSD